MRAHPVIQMPYHPSGPSNQFMTAVRLVFNFINHHTFQDKLSLSKASCRIVNDLVIDAFQKLLKETQLLMSHQKRRSLTSRSLDEAVKLLIQHPDFARRCQFFGRKAVCDYFRHRHAELTEP